MPEEPTMPDLVELIRRNVEAFVEARNAWVTTWDGGKIVRTTMYTDLDEGRAAAERLAHERG